MLARGATFLTCLAVVITRTDSLFRNTNQHTPFKKGVLEYTSYALGPGPVCVPSEPVRRPESVPEVVAIVQEAIRRKTTCKAVGELHSSTDIICTSGIPIDMTKIGGLRLNPDSTVTAGAGVSLRDIADFLQTRGRAMRTVPAFGNITVGGAIGTGAHGSSLRHPASISDHVVEVVVVDGLAKIRRIRDEAELRAFRVHLGLLGIILEVTLKTVPLYKVRAHNYVVSDEVLTDERVLQMAEDSDHISMYWFPSFGKLVVANWTNVDANTPGDAVTNDHTPSTTESFHYYATRFIELGQRRASIDLLNLLQAYTLETLVRKVPDFPPIYSEDGVRVLNPAVGYYHKMTAPICYSEGWRQCAWFHGKNSLTFLDNEMQLELSKLPDFIRTVKDILNKYPAVFPFQGILLRFSPASNALMSGSWGRKTCNFEFYTSLRKDVYEHSSFGIGAYQTILQSSVFNFSARAHWGKVGSFYHNKEMLDLKLEKAAKNMFIQKMKEYDPNGIFMNDFGNRLLGKDSKINTDPRIEHCALLDNCLCSRNQDCAKGQECSTITGYPEYPVCKSWTSLEPVNPYVSLRKHIRKLLRDYRRNIFRIYGEAVQKTDVRWSDS